MVFNIERHEREIFQLISDTAEELSYPAYVVGGYVRDRLLGRPSKDMDIVCVGNGIRLAQNVAARLRPIPRITVYKRFGTAMLKHKDLEIEFVGARKESYRHDSRKPTVEEGTLEDDQNRRDFTINALAVSLNARDFGAIIDPFHGLQHLEEKVIKTPLEPGDTFSDDPLRMMRAIRFATQLHFEIEPETLAAISQYKQRINIVSKERITAELEKIMATDLPSVGFKLLHSTGLLKIIFPELQALHGVEVRNGKGHKDNFFHTLEVLDNLCKKSHNIWLRWAALLHDIAKPPTKRFHPEQGWTFHGHDALGAAMVPRIFKRMRLPLDGKMKFVQKMVRLHLRPISLTKENITDSAIRRLLFDAGDDIDDLMLLCEADITSKNPKKVARYLENYELVRDRLIAVEENDRIRNWQPPITGDLIMETFGIPPSKEVGMLKDFVRDAILDGDIPNAFEPAFQLLLEKAAEMGLQPRSNPQDRS
ncbi:MAG: HD domain-containing protein [Saprospiraceae bacterium]|nr:HD domain-containing protein [Saprospiraceae bacterium]MCB0675077.1 HD domain-containing protein [Saprospiraceae bacterium]MCB0682725.1 HD domain-containing protein [Saprospiraceae bacterium]